MTRKVRLHIDRLVLSGLGHVDPVAFERALNARIAQALTEAERTGGLQDIRSGPKIDGGQIARPGDPAALGSHLAARITGGRS